MDQLLKRDVGTVQEGLFSTPEGHSLPFDVPSRVDLSHEVVPDSDIPHMEVPSSTETDKAPLPFTGEDREDNLAEDPSCNRHLQCTTEILLAAKRCNTHQA